MVKNVQDLPLKQYSVVWHIELLANSPEEAALEALDSIMLGTARVFEVTENTSKHTVLIDLDNQDDGT